MTETELKQENDLMQRSKTIENLRTLDIEDRLAKAEAACAEKQRVLVKLHQVHLDTMAEVRDTGYSEGMCMSVGDFCDVCSAIKNEAGKGWVSPEKHKEMTDSHAKAWELYYQAQDKLTIKDQVIFELSTALSSIITESFNRAVPKHELREIAQTAVEKLNKLNQ